MFADVCVFFLAVAYARGVHVGIENPAGSILFSCLSEYLSRFPSLQQVVVQRCAFDQSPLGQRIQKKYKVVGTGYWVQKIAKPCVCPAHTAMTRRGLPAKCSMQFGTCSMIAVEYTVGQANVDKCIHQTARPMCKILNCIICKFAES